MAKITRFLGIVGWHLCAGLLLSAAPPAHAQVVPQAIPANVEIIRFDGFPFPRQVAGLSRNKRSDYQVPGAGFSVSYIKQGETAADIYVYDRQLNLSSGQPVALAREELKTSLEEVNSAVKAGLYERAVVGDQSASGSFVKARLTIVRNGKELRSYVFITIHKGKFVKIRLSSYAGEASNEIAEKFLAEYARLLSKP